MKKIIFVLFLSISAIYSSGNIAAPQAYISEILVDSTGNWTIEMGFFEWDYSEIDSIRLVTSSGSSLLTYYTFIPSGGGLFDSLSVITIANLANPVSINPGGDFVKLISYAYGDEPFDKVAFGNYPGSFLDCIRDGESVINVMGQYCMDISPTIGSGNDTTGAMGNFSGVAYNLLGNPFTEGLIFIQGIPGITIHLNPDGSFLERIYSRRYNFDTILYYHPPEPMDYYTTELVDFCLRPDSSHYHNIITTSLVIGIEEKDEDDENAVVISPNPFSDKVVFYFNLKNEFSSGELNLSIYDLNGREVHQVSLFGDQKRYEWVLASSISSGTYIYRLEKEKQLIKTGKLVRL